MKKILISSSCLFALMLAISGCNTVPTSENAYATSYMIGVSTGMIMNNTDIKNEQRGEIIAILNEVKSIVPEADHSFKESWTPIAESHVSRLIDDGKINQVEGNLILTTFNTVVLGIDYLFDVRYPEYRQYKDINGAAVHGFISGLLDTYREENYALQSTNKAYDKEAYEFLMIKNGMN